MDDAPGDIPASCDSVTEGINGEAGFHPVSNGISNNAPGEHVFDCAEVKLPFPGSMFCDVHQP